MDWFKKQPPAPNVITEPVIQKKMQEARIAMAGMPVQIHTGAASINIQLTRLRARRERLWRQIEKKIANGAAKEHVDQIKEIAEDVDRDIAYLSAKLERMK